MERTAGGISGESRSGEIDLYSFDTAEKAKAKDQTKSSFYQLLNGDDWKFSWAVKPADRIGAKRCQF